MSGRERPDIETQVAGMDLSDANESDWGYSMSNNPDMSDTRVWVLHWVLAAFLTGFAVGVLLAYIVLVVA